MTGASSLREKRAEATTFPNAMVDRIACAISGAPFSTLRSRNKAREVLRVMREPTTDMEVAGTEEWLCEACQEDRSGTNWRAMIDAALSEDSTTTGLAPSAGEVDHE